MAVTLATAFIQLQPSARGFKAAIGREIGPDLRKAGETAGTDTSRSFGKTFSGGMRNVGRVAAVGLGAAFAGAAVLGKQAIDAASNLEETQSKVNTVFGEGADEINAWAKSAATAIGQSKEQALAAAGSFGNLFTQLGIGSDTAASMSTEMVTLASDFASFHNADITEVIDAQTAAFRGEYDSLQKFVPTINAAAVEQRAMELGLAATTGELDAQDKALATQALIMEGAGDAAGDFARTSDGLANQQRVLAARFEDAKASIGQALLPAMTAVVGFISDKVIPAVQELAATWMPRLKAGFEAVSDFVRNNWPQVKEIVTNIFDGLRTAFTYLIDHKPILIGVFSGITAGMIAWGVASLAAATASAAAWIAAAAPFFAIGAAVALAVGGFVLAYNKIEVFRTVVDGVVDAVVAIGKWLVDAWRKYADDIGRTFATFGRVVGKVFEQVISVVRVAINAIAATIRVGVATFKTTWAAISAIFTFFRDNVVAPIMAKVGELRDGVARVIGEIVSKAKSTWSGVVGVFNFFRDQVYTPVVTKVGQLRDVVARIFGEAVSKMKSAWDGLRAIVDFFRVSVYDPVMRRVNQLKDAIGGAFEKAVSAVKSAWDALKNVVKAPINVVIGFYNNGIRRVWNSVISKIPGIGDLGEVQTLNRGGRVPGSGNKDTVPAMLTPGEFVVTKKAAQAWGPKVLAALNDSGGTIDPAVFGYAAGGYVRSVDEAMAWAKGHAGKPYRFPDVGPGSFDCSGLTSALINFILGRNPYSRRHSSGSVRNDPALAPGDGNGSGLMIGARPPYMTNSTGQRVGHVAATLQNLAGGLNVEATPPRVRVGAAARGAKSATFNELYHMPGYSGFPTADVVATGNSLKDLLGMKVSGQKPPFGDLIQKMINTLPRKVFDFLGKQLPAMMVNAIKEVFGNLFGPNVTGTASFADGGMVRRNGPILVGERGPEVAWGSRGMYIENNDDLRRRQGDGLGVTVNNYRTSAGEAEIARGIRMARLQ